MRLPARGSARREIVVPDRLVAQRRHKGTVGLALLIGQSGQQRHGALPSRHVAHDPDADFGRLGRQNELRLSRSCEVDIDLCQKLGIKQRTVFGVRCELSIE